MFGKQKKYRSDLASLILLLLLVILHAENGSSQLTSQSLETLSSSNLVNQPYISPTPGQFPIIASSPWVDGRPTSVEDLSQVKDCGFNAILSYVSLPYFIKAAPLLQEAGLKAIVGFPEFATPAGPSIVDTLKHNPVIGAWRFSDEPREINFDNLAPLCRNIEVADTAHMAYINLVGSEAKEYFLGSCPDFPAFINEFQKDFKPGVWSYDLYPITKRDGKISVAYQNFYESLEIFSKISSLTQRPFWAYCQSMAFSHGGVEKPAANLAYLSFEAMSAIGYGAKGLVYWTYYQRPSNETTFISALKNLDGEITPAWYAARQLNLEIQALSPILLNASHTGTWHSGNQIPPMCREFKQSFECLSSVTPSAIGVQLSFLHDGDNSYLIVVNKDVGNSQKIALQFLSGYNISQIEPIYKKGVVSLKQRKSKGKVTKTLLPGRYLIFRYSKSL